MIEVVEHGRVGKDQRYIVSCGRCGCKFKFNESDKKHSYSPCIKCPECRSLTPISRAFRI